MAAWSGFLLFIGAGAFAVGMAIHNEALASHRVPQARESSIYYYATGAVFPAFEPCEEMKGLRESDKGRKPHNTCTQTRVSEAARDGENDHSCQAHVNTAYLNCNEAST